MKKETILYHYTNFASFDSILRNSELRVNNVLNMNDAMEMRLFMQGLCKAVVKRCKDNGYDKEVEYINNLFKEGLENEYFYSSYAACFSKYRDDAAQWERYGNGGKGVCIAFDKNGLEKISKSIASLEKVYYQENIEEHELVDMFMERIEKREAIDDLMKEAWICSAAFKHPSFSSENEMRLIVTPFAQDYLNVKPQYHVSKDRIKKYYPLNLQQMCMDNNAEMKNLIKEIIIGPESNQTIYILQDYLKDTGYEYLANRVTLSNCPLRRMNL